MEWKVITGQIVAGIVAVVAMVTNQNSGIVLLIAGGLLTSIGYPAVVQAVEKKEKDGYKRSVLQA